MNDIAAKTDALFRTITKKDGKGYSYREIAERSGNAFSSTTVWKVRSGQIKNPTLKVLKGICKAFGIPISYYPNECASEENIPQYQAEQDHDQMLEQIALGVHQLDADGKRAILSIVNYILELQQAGDDDENS